jgi:hypothetical protein
MSRKHQGLHIEAPGCIVNIRNLNDSEGQPITFIDVNADGDRYSGEPEWWCIDAGAILGVRGIGIRIVQGIDKPTERYVPLDERVPIP